MPASSWSSWTRRPATPPAASAGWRRCPAARRTSGAASLAVPFDLCHGQVVEGDQTRRLARHLDPAAPTPVGHLQVAGVPDRHEPDPGELDSGWLFGPVDALGWRGWIGAEHRPRGATREGLGGFRRRRRHAGARERP